ncbi:MAG TPA: PAS domain S-box protein, partial [Plasticicumulans sp.]|nr:PAS domain S-box protein [Plasticicumulans sp.]
TDVQAARETAEALRASEARFRALLDQAADAIYVHDADGRLCDVNHRACETLGLPRATLLTMNVADVDPALPAAGLAFWHTLTPGESLTLRSRHRRGDGSDFPVELSVGAVEIGGERRLLALARDISERERAEAEIHELNASLEQRVAERTAELTAANRELDAFAYAVSHDLRAPLRAMSGFSTALLEDCAGQLDADGRAYLDQIIAGSRRMGELIDGLLALSRSTRGELRRERVDVTAIMARVREELEADEPQRRVHWQVEPDLHVWGDAGMLDAVFANLAGNAWKYTARTADPVIRVQAAEAAAGFLCVCVSDNGAGFDPRHAGKLFLPFQRLHRQDEFPGLGIGLATAQRIVHRHGGTIAASAAPGLGARFCITLPGPQVASEEPES